MVFPFLPWLLLITGWDFIFLFITIINVLCLREIDGLYWMKYNERAWDTAVNTFVMCQRFSQLMWSCDQVVLRVVLSFLINCVCHTLMRRWNERFFQLSTLNKSILLYCSNSNISISTYMFRRVNSMYFVTAILMTLVRLCKTLLSMKTMCICSRFLYRIT